MNNTKQCPITAQITYLGGDYAGIKLIRTGDKFVHDGNISMMVYNLRRMILKNIHLLSDASIFDNRLTFQDRRIFEWTRLKDGTEVTLKNNLASYLVQDFAPVPAGTECDVTRKNYEVVKKEGGRQ